MADKEKFLNDVGLSHVITKTKELLDGKVDVDSSVVYASEDGAVEVDILVEDVQAALLKKVDKAEGAGLFPDEYKETVDQLASAELKPEGMVYAEFDNDTEEVGEVESVDANTLNGHSSNYFASADSLADIMDGTTTVRKAYRDGSNNVITSTYATKTELTNASKAANTYTDKVATTKIGQAELNTHATNLDKHTSVTEKDKWDHVVNKLESELAVDFEEAKEPAFQESITTLTNKLDARNVTSIKVDDVETVRLPLEAVVDAIEMQEAESIVSMNKAKTSAITAIENKGTATLATIPNDYTTVANDVESLKSDLSESYSELKETSLNYSTETLTIVRNEGYFIEADGDIVAIEHYFYSDLIELNVGEILSVTSKDPSGSFVTRVSKWENGDFIRSNFIEVLNLGTTEETTYEYTATEHCYIRLCGYKYYDMTVVKSSLIVPVIFSETVGVIATEKAQEVYEEINQTEYVDIAMFEDIAVCGDSFTAGTIFVDGTTVGDIEKVSWGKALGRMSGINVTVYASGGADTNTWQTRTECLPRLLNDTARELYVLVLGINDATLVTLGTIADITSDYTQNPNTFYGNYGKIIEQIKSHAPNAKIIISKTFLPKFAGGAFYNYSSNAVEKIAEYYNIPFIETKDSDFLMSDTYNVGVGTHGNHPTAPLHSGIAKAMKEMLSKSISDNMDYFNDYH